MFMRRQLHKKYRLPSRMSCQQRTRMTILRLPTVVKKHRADCFSKMDSLPNTIRLIRIPPSNTDHKELSCKL